MTESWWNEIELTSPELLLAAFAGSMRQTSAITHNRPTTYGRDRVNAWEGHIHGAAAEMGVAKYLDRFWSPLSAGRLGDIPGDVSDGIQVRSTERMDGSLIVHPEDHDEHRFYLALTYKLPTVVIVGSILGGHAKHPDYWRTEGVRHPAYFVPQDALNPDE